MQPSLPPGATMFTGAPFGSIPRGLRGERWEASARGPFPLLPDTVVLLHAIAVLTGALVVLLCSSCLDGSAASHGLPSEPRAVRFRHWRWQGGTERWLLGLCSWLLISRSLTMRACALRCDAQDTISFRENLKNGNCIHRSLALRGLNDWLCAGYLPLVTDIEHRCASTLHCFSLARPHAS